MNKIRLNRLPFFIFLAFLSAGLLSHCLFQDRPEPPVPEEAPDGAMVMIPANGQSFFQGAFESSGSQSVLQVSFEYDFWMDSIEVTQQKYFEATGFEPVLSQSPFGYSDSLPVYNVSWYDAVFYCNAMSKKLGMDTVYSYTDLIRASDNSIYSMGGLNTDYSKKGYRLPTEAEWEFAARAESTTPFFWGDWADSALAVQYAWFLDNAEGHVHPAALLKPNPWNLYDMSGNVMEWVGGWRGNYTGSVITNSIGAAIPNSGMERSVKGGAFNYGIHALRCATREATYPAISSSKTEYVGFRCVIGTFEDGAYYSETGAYVQSSPVQIAAGKSEIRNAFLTDQVKVCFVNVTGSTRNLCYLDFSLSDIIINEIRDTLPVFHPVISPDGQFAAFCTRAEGTHTPSSIYIRRLDPLGSGLVKVADENGHIPRWWVSPAANDTFLIYTSSSIDNKEKALWDASSTFRQKIVNGMPAGAAEILTSQGSFHDGLSADGKNLVTGFSQILVKNLDSGLERQLFLSPENGKDASGSVQVCNVSMSSDSANPLLAFLDFGYPRISSLTGTAYGVHEYIFISDLNGNFQSALRRPEGYDAWNHTEWSNHSDVLISSTDAPGGDTHSFYLFNPESPDYLKLMEGKDIHQPALWISERRFLYEDARKLGLDLDSLGHYMEPAIDTYQLLWAMKMKYFWMHHNSWDGVVIGSSRANDGINPASFTGFSVINLGYPGADLKGFNKMVKHYIFTQAPQTRFVITSLSMGWLWQPDESFSWNTSIEPSIGFQYDANHNFWETEASDDFHSLILSASYPDWSNHDEFGHHQLYPKGWGPAEIVDMVGEKDTTDAQFISNFVSLISTIELMQIRNMHLVMVAFPQSPEYYPTPYYGKYGPLKTTAESVLKKIKALEQTYPNFHFYDAHQFGNHDYASEEGVDSDHLSQAGAVKLSTRLDSLIHQILD